MYFCTSVFKSPKCFTRQLVINKYEYFIVADNGVVEYAVKLQAMGARNVLVSMAGSGAILLCENGRLIKCGVCMGTVKNSVGAGDSMLAGFVAGSAENDLDYALKLGTACGGATAFSEGLAKKELIFELLKQLKTI